MGVSGVQVSLMEFWVTKDEMTVGAFGRTPTGTNSGSEYTLVATSLTDFSLNVYELPNPVEIAKSTTSSEGSIVVA